MGSAGAGFVPDSGAKQISEGAWAAKGVRDTINASTAAIGAVAATTAAATAATS